MTDKDSHDEEEGEEEEEEDVWQRLLRDRASKDVEMRCTDGSVFVHSLVLRNSGSRILAAMIPNVPSATSPTDSSRNSNNDHSNCIHGGDGVPHLISSSSPSPPPLPHSNGAPQGADDDSEATTIVVDDDIRRADLETLLRVLYLGRVDNLVADGISASKAGTVDRAAAKRIVKMARRWRLEEVASRFERLLCQSLCEETLVGDLDFAVEKLYGSASSSSTTSSGDPTPLPTTTASTVFRRCISELLVANPAFFLHHIQRFRRTHVEFILSAVPQADIPQGFFLSFFPFLFVQKKNIFFHFRG